MLVTRLLLYVVLALLVYRALRRFFAGVAQGMGTDRPAGRIEQGVRMSRDPVCGTFVIPSSTLAVRDADGLHHFCSAKCRDAFVAGARRKG